jgi:hypothetical protein
MRKDAMLELNFSGTKQYACIKVRSVILSVNESGAKKNDPLNNSCDKIGTYIEIANYT